MKTIAIVDDDIHIGNLLEEVLAREGYATVRAYSGSEAALLLSQTRPDLVLLDLMLPGMSGEAVLPLIKGIPVIVLSAKVTPGDKVTLLRSGAADYITKPFDIHELLARIEVQFRKDGAQSDTVLRLGRIRLDPATREVFAHDAPIHLTKTEYAILKLLMRHPGQVMAKSTILDHISEDTPDCMESSLKVHVSNLRRKLKEPGGEDPIEAVWGIGFRMREPA